MTFSSAQRAEGMWWKQAFELFGFGSAFVLSGAIYAIFHFLDRNASGAAKRVISQWINGDSYETLDARSAIVNSFDHIYGFPLIHPVSLFKSSTYSIVAFIIFANWLIWPNQYRALVITWINPFARFVFITSVLANILSDYLALFVVRRSLISSKAFSSGIIRGTLLGVTVIVVVQIAVAYLSEVLWAHSVLAAAKLLTLTFSIGIKNFPVIVILSCIPAFLVLLWLPLLGVAAMVTRVLRALMRTLRWAQWFIKQGNQHPLRAIGLVAAALMFVATALAEVFR